MASVRLDTKNVGDIIKIKENGTARDFIVVHKGAPSTAYYGMNGGVIVLRKDIHSNGVYDSRNNDYANSDIHSWCNNTYLNTIQEDVRSQIMTVRIPYRRGTSGSSVSTGANGLQCKAFLLSTKEVDSTESYSPNEGAVFSYFSGGGNSRRIARLNGSPNYWWLRSPFTSMYLIDYAWLVTPNGDIYNEDYTVQYSYGRRPAFVLPGTLYVDDSGNVVTNESPTAPGAITADPVVGGGTTTITLASPATDPDGSVVNYQYEHKVDGGTYEVFSTVNALTTQEEIDADWGTVQYRACAIDNQGATGPYVESPVYEVNSGYIMIGGPSSNMGEKNVPFTFNATLDVSGQDSITGIHVRAWVDSHLMYDQTKNQGDTISFEVDTRTMATGSHAIRVTAEHDSVLPAKADYTFIISGGEVPEGGRSVQAEDEYGHPIWFRVMGRDVIANGNESIMNEIEDLRTQHFGATGRLEHVDTVSGVSSYTLTREVGVTYGVTLYPQIAGGTTTPMLRFSIPNGYTGNVTLGSIGSVKAESGTVTFTIPTTAVLSISKYTMDTPVG